MNNNSGSGMATKQQRGRVTPQPPPQQQRRMGAPICCNRCERPLATSLFVCGCFCVFCEDCTIDHFQQNPNCPICGRTLSDNDFMSLVIGEMPVVHETVKSTFQKLFMKKPSSSSSSSPLLQFADMTAQINRLFNDFSTANKFMLKQLVESSNKQVEENGNLRRVIDSQQQELIQLKQSQSGATRELQIINDDLQQQLLARNATIADMQRQLDEKEDMLNKFRRIHSGMVTRSPSSSPLHGSGGTGGGGTGIVNAPHGDVHAATTIPVSSHSHRTAYHEAPPPPHQHHQEQQPTPLQGYMARSAAEERAKQQALQSQLNRGVVLGRGVATGGGGVPNMHNHPSLSYGSIPSGVSPVQLPSRRPFGTSHNNNSSSPGVASVVIPSTPSRPREMSSSAGYVFTSRANPYQQQHRHVQQAQPARRTPPTQSRGISSTNGLSPTMAFARNYGSGRYGSTNNGFGHH